jgi:hypothetical protein
MSSNEGDCLSQRGGNSKRVKKTLTIFKNLLLQNQQAKINQIWYILSWVIGIQVCSVKGPGPLQRGDNCKKGVGSFKNVILMNLS